MVKVTIWVNRGLDIPLLVAYITREIKNRISARVTLVSMKKVDTRIRAKPTLCRKHTPMLIHLGLFALTPNMQEKTVALYCTPKNRAVISAM